MMIECTNLAFYDVHFFEIAEDTGESIFVNRYQGQPFRIGLVPDSTHSEKRGQNRGRMKQRVKQRARDTGRRPKQQII
jgi:hypothetical protein